MHSAIRQLASKRHTTSSDTGLQRPVRLAPRVSGRENSTPALPQHHTAADLAAYIAARDSMNILGVPYISNYVVLVLCVSFLISSKRVLCCVCKLWLYFDGSNGDASANGHTQDRRGLLKLESTE